METSKIVMNPKAEEPNADEPKAKVVKKEDHAPHSFEWSASDKRTTTVTCNKAGTVENSLRQSHQFRKLEAKNKENKELVVLRGGKVISSHFPCSLIQPGEHLSVQYVKAPEKLQQPSDQSGYAREGLSDQYVVFNVLPKGRKNVVKILRNTTIEALAQELTVYAHKGEKVKHALKRDGRFQKTIFEKTCALADTRTDADTEMSNLVDDLDGKTFQITLLDKSRPPDSQPGSLDDTWTVESEVPPSDVDENSHPSPSSAPAEKDEKPKLNDLMVCEIPDSQKMRDLLYSQLENWLKTEMEGKPKQSVSRFLTEEFGKCYETSFEVKTGKTLMHLSDSVCQIRINGSPEGSGFLLFDTFVLTNGHVLKNSFDMSTRQLHRKVTVHFSYESLNQVDVGQEVQEVVAFEYGNDVSGYRRDWALLSLRPGQKLPVGLLRHFEFCPPGGSIYITGHPYGDVKRTDPCWIIPIGDRAEAVRQHEHYSAVQFFTHTFYENLEKQIQFNRQILTYNTCFYHYSSGSPVFDSQCNVVAMHSGGYNYKTPGGRKDSVIDFGYPLSDIIEQMIIQLVQGGKLDVLTKYLSCNFSKSQDVMNNVKKVVESIEFKNTINSPEIKNSESWRRFIELFTSQRNQSHRIGFNVQR